MNVSEIFGKKVLSTSGKRGYVLSVNAGGEFIEGLVCADDDDNEFTVDIKNVIKFGNELLFEDRESAIKSAKPLKLGRASYTADGKFLGLAEEFVFKGNKITGVKIGARKYPMQYVVFDDAVIIKDIKKLKSDVIKDGKVIIKKGAPLTDETLEIAAKSGEYVQATLKTL